MNLWVTLGLTLCGLLATAWIFLYPRYRQLRMSRAIWDSDLPFVQKALARGFPVEAPLLLGDTALQAAATVHPRSVDDRKPYEIVQQILAAGANPNDAEPNGMSPLVKAIFGGDAEMVRCLIKGGAQVNQPNAKDMPPLFSALRGIEFEAFCPARRREVVEALLEAGASVSAQVGKFPSALQVVEEWEVRSRERPVEWQAALRQFLDIQEPELSEEEVARRFSAHQVNVREVIALVRAAGVQSL